MKIYYYDYETGLFLGDGESSEIVENSTDIKPIDNNYYFKDGKWNEIIIPAKTPEEIKQDIINNNKRYLLDTDWIVIKIQETNLKGEDINPLLDKYSIELVKRKESRILINELEV